MKVRVQYMAQLRAVIGHTTEEIELPDGSSVTRLLAELATRHADARTHLVTEARQARPSLIVVVNEAAVSARDAATTALPDGAVVTLLPPIAGG